jgi:hypothetical protein
MKSARQCFGIDRIPKCLQQVARMERSDIRVGVEAAPDFAVLNPGYACLKELAELPGK